MSTLSPPLGELVDTSTPCTAPERITLHGNYVDLVPFSPSHTQEIWPLMSGAQNESIWHYWPVGPYPNVEAFESDFKDFYEKLNPLFWAIIDLETGKCQGQAALGELSIENRNIECGMFVTLPMQKTTGCTEAFYLVAKYAFELGFRRLAWKTNSLNLPSRRAAERYGMQLEGIWRQHQINKGRNRDSAWYSMIDKEWPVRKLAFEKWLHPDNFDTEGKQRRSLVAIREQLEAEAVVSNP